MTYYWGQGPVAREDEESEIMSLLDAEMSRLKGLLRVAERERNAAVVRANALDQSAQRLADYFINKTTNLVTMRCDFCEREWVRDAKPGHDGDCPVGIVKTTLEG